MNRHLTPAEIADGILPSLRPSPQQEYRRLVNEYKHNSRKLPWDDIDWRAHKMADKLRLIRDIRDAKEALARRMEEEPVILDEDEESHRYTTERNQRDIARDIYHGGERP